MSRHDIRHAYQVQVTNTGKCLDMSYTSVPFSKRDVILPRHSTKFGSWRAIVTLQRYVALRLLPKSIPVYYNFTTLFAAFRKKSQ